MRQRRIRSLAAGAAALTALLLNPAPASAATGTSDTASPVYRTDTAPNAANKFECSDYACEFVITTTTRAYPCASELIVVAAGQPAILYPGTFCQVSISGRFDVTGVGEGEPCAMHALHSLKVRFTSGANLAFDGAFDVSGLFKPTGFTADRRRVTQAQVTVKGSDPLDANPFGTGTIAGASFTVRFPGAGILMCFPSATGTSAGRVAAVTSHGTVVVAP
jgi:hypothetical protein